jgi:hypothetical protein
MAASTDPARQDRVPSLDTARPATVRASTDPAVPAERPAPSGPALVRVDSANLRSDDPEPYVLYSLSGAAGQAWAATSPAPPPDDVRGNPRASLGAFPTAFKVGSSDCCPPAWGGAILLDKKDPNAITLTLQDVAVPVAVPATFSDGVLYGGDPKAFSGLFELTIDPSGTHLVGAVVWIEDPGPVTGSTVGVWAAEAGSGDDGPAHGRTA